MMQRIFRSLTCAGALVVFAAQFAHANSGIQLPLNQYSAGSESTMLVSNGNFESGASGWTPSGNIITAAPIFSNTSNNGLLSAQMNDASSPASFTQNAPALTANANYVLSGYLWNAGRYDVSGFGSGDLATLKLVDPNNATFNNISMTLEAQASNGGAGSNGYFMYIMANQAQMAAWSSIQIQAIGEEGSVAGTLPANWAQWDNIALTPSESFVGQKWTGSAGGSWTDGTKWQGGQVPNAAGAVATFNSPTSQTISTASAITVAQINFNSAASQTINGNGPITLDVTSDGFGQQQGVPEIAVVSGSHTISAPISLPKSTIINVGPANSILTLSNQVSASSGVTITKNGAGELDMLNVRADALTINAGYVKVLSSKTDAATSNVKALNISGSTGAWTSTFDLNDNALVVDYTGSSPFATIRDQIISGHNGPVFAWTGKGITSTAAISHPEAAIGYAEATEIFSSFPATFRGQSVDNTSVLAVYTLSGDANLDNTVDTVDFNLLAASFSQNATDWAHGDFNYDGSTDTVDFNLLASNFGKIDPAPALGSVVPEPTMVGLLALTLLASARLRRRVPARSR